MWTKQQIEVEKRKVEAASLGEVVLFCGPNLLNGAHQIMLGNTRFQANIGIYKGFTEDECDRVVGGEVYCTLNENQSMELAIQRETEHLQDLVEAQEAAISKNSGTIIEEGGTRIIIIPSSAINAMNLSRTNTVAYVGVEQIAGVFRREANGLLDDFLRRYVEQYRDVSSP